MKNIPWILAISVLVAGCSSILEPQPVGQGTGNSELKRSPCACIQVPQEPAPPGYFERLKV
jgi:uncharacterized protein YceK